MEGSKMEESLGSLLQTYRSAAKLSQEELAEKAVLSVNAISALECGVRCPYPDTLRRLTKALELNKEQDDALWTARRRLLDERGPRPIPTIPAGRDNSPPAYLIPLLGRAEELTALSANLRAENVRMLTLIGPGGVGKTHLAVAVGRELSQDFPDGVVFVDLAQLRDPTLVASAIAERLGVTANEQQSLPSVLISRLQAKKMLLILDNFERVLEAASLLVLPLLRACHTLKVLATSRIPLHLSGEHEVVVRPLALPDLAHLPAVEKLSAYPAVALFVYIARTKEPTFTLTEANGTTVATICVRLDGLPLAIVLAASRVKVLSLQDLLTRLNTCVLEPKNSQRFGRQHAQDLPERNQTLRGTINWSYDLLDNDEQLLFARLSVFVGGCTLVAAEAVCNADRALPFDVLDVLDSLVDKSLLMVQKDEDGDTRYSMLETIYEYAQERLETRHEEDTMAHAHVEWLLEWAQNAHPEDRPGPEQTLWAQRLMREHGNILAALEWCKTTGSIEKGLQLIIALWWHFYIQGYLQEGRAWLATFIEAAGGPGSTSVPTLVMAQALNKAGLFAYRQGDYHEAQGLCEASLERLSGVQPAPSDRDRAEFLHTLGTVYLVQNEYEKALKCLEESLQIRENLSSEERGISNVCNAIGNVHEYQGRYTEALAWHNRSLNMRRARNDPVGISTSLINIGEIARRQGDYARARTLLLESLKLKRAHNDTWGEAHAFHALGNLARDEGDFHGAQTYFEQSRDLFASIDNKQGRSAVLNGLANLECDRDNIALAQKLWEESYELRNSLRNPLGLASARATQARIEAARGNHEHAERLYEESRQVRSERGDRWSVAEALEGLANVAYLQEQWDVAWSRYSEAQKIREAMGAPLPHVDQDFWSNNALPRIRQATNGMEQQFDQVST